MNRVRWLLIAMVFVVAAVSYLDRNNISVAASAIQAEFGLSNARMGTVFSAFVLGYALCQPLAGRAADRYGPRRVVAFGILWWSAFTAATAWMPARFVWSAAGLMVVRLLLGAGESVIFPASNRLVAAWIPRGERGLASGLVFAGVGIGAGVAPPLITYLTLRRDWHWSFLITACIGLVALCFWLVLARDRPEEHPWVGHAELDWIRSNLPLAAAGELAVPWSAIIRHRDVRLLATSYLTYGYVAYIFFTWFFKYLSVVRGLDLKASAAYGMLPFIAMAATSPMGGWMADRLSRHWGERRGRCWTAAAALATSAVFVSLSTRVADPRTASVVLALGAGSLYLSQSAYWTLTANIGGSSAGSVSGFMNMFNQIGGVVTASLTPVLADRFGWSTSFGVAAALCLLGALAWVFVDPASRLAAVRSDQTSPPLC
jgi:ACS family glucarate transporter-like MFS transporter